MRVLVNQRNTWGSQGNTDNPQRADLWIVDLNSVVFGLNTQIKANPNYGIDVLPDLPTYFAQSISLPELKVAAEVFKRDSVPYQMPVQDEPVGQTKITFIMDSPGAVSRSKIYQLLDTWRLFTRAGRTTFGAENAIPLNDHYTVTHAFNIGVQLLRGASQPFITQISNGVGNDYFNNINLFTTKQQSVSPDLRQAQMDQIMDNVAQTDLVGVINDLEVCGHYILEQAWLSSFKISDLTYVNGNTIATIDAIFYCENLLDVLARAQGMPTVYDSFQSPVLTTQLVKTVTVGLEPVRNPGTPPPSVVRPPVILPPVTPPPPVFGPPVTFPPIT